MPTIPEILNYPDQAPVTEVQAKVIAVYALRTIPTKFGPKSVQNFEIQDSAGNRMPGTAWAHPDLMPLKGNEYVLHSNKGKGLKLVFDTYTPKGQDNPKTTKKLEIDKSGTFQHVEVYAAQKVPAAPQEVPQKGGSGESNTRLAPSPQRPVEPAERAKLSMTRLCNLWLMSFEYAKFYIDPLVKAMTGIEMGLDQFQACVSSLYIQASKDNVIPPTGIYQPSHKPQADEKEPF